MSLTTLDNVVQFIGNGSTVDVPFNKTFNLATDLTVYLTVIATGVSTTQTLGVDYTVTGAGVNGGGTVTFTVAPPSTVRGTIVRTVGLDQSSIFNENGAFPVKVVEAGLDKATMINQQQQNILSRSLTIPVTDPVGTIINLPNSVDRANKVLTFDGNGNLAATVDGGVYRGNYTATEIYKFRDLMTDPSNGNLYFTLVAFTATVLADDVTAGNIVLILDTAFLQGAPGLPGGVSYCGTIAGSAPQLVSVGLGMSPVQYYTATLTGYTYTDGSVITGVVDTTNSCVAPGDITRVYLNVNNMGYINVITDTGDGEFLQPGALQSGCEYSFMYVAGNFYLLAGSQACRKLACGEANTNTGQSLGVGTTGVGAAIIFTNTVATETGGGIPGDPTSGIITFSYYNKMYNISASVKCTTSKVNALGLYRYNGGSYTLLKRGNVVNSNYHSCSFNHFVTAAEASYFHILAFTENSDVISGTNPLDNWISIQEQR